MKTLMKNSVFAVALASAFLFAAPVVSENRYFGDGTPVDPEAWLEDARIDPVDYFVFSDSQSRQKNCLSDIESIDADSVDEFFDHFNGYVEDDVFDELDVRLVWFMRECLTNDAMQEELGVARNTYFFRLNKIRTQMLLSYQ